jgi:hypothetical protein
MKELFGQAVLVISLVCASVALVGGMTGWIDFHRLAESFPSSPTATGPQQSASNSAAAQLLPEGKAPEQKAPEPKPVKPVPAAAPVQLAAPPAQPAAAPAEPAIAPAKPQTVETKPPEQEAKLPEIKPPQQTMLATGYDQLRGLGREAAGYGLYSYAVFTSTSPRSAAFLSELFKSIPSIGAARPQLNIFYIPTKKEKVPDLATLVEASRNDQTKLAVRYSEAMYDYKMARAILSHLCNPPAKAMTSLCKGPMSGGPYILANARPASTLEPVPPPFLFVDLSDINPHAYPEFISAFRAVVKQEDATDDAKLYSLRLKVLNLGLTAADWTPNVKKSVVDIVHAFESSPDGQASR